MSKRMIWKQRAPIESALDPLCRECRGYGWVYKTHAVAQTRTIIADVIWDGKKMEAVYQTETCGTCKGRGRHA